MRAPFFKFIIAAIIILNGYVMTGTVRRSALTMPSMHGLRSQRIEYYQAWRPVTSFLLISRDLIGLLFFLMIVYYAYLLDRLFRGHYQELAAFLLANMAAILLVHCFIIDIYYLYIPFAAQLQAYYTMRKWHVNGNREPGQHFPFEMATTFAVISIGWDVRVSIFFLVGALAAALVFELQRQHGVSYHLNSPAAVTPADSNKAKKNKKKKNNNKRPRPPRDDPVVVDVDGGW